MRSVLENVLVPLALLAVPLVAGACTEAQSDDPSNEDAVRSVERAALGKALPYVPDTTLAARAPDLAKSQKARREVAWKALAKILKDVNTSERAVRVNGRRIKIPLFRTWYQKDDFERMFGKAYGDYTPAQRKSRLPFSNTVISSTFDWNGKDRGSWTEQAYFDRIRQVDTRKEAQGLAGNARVSYSPGFISHTMKNYGILTKCMRGQIADNPTLDLNPTSNFAPCLDAEFPTDAAIFKAAWLRADFGGTVGVRPTTPDAIKDRRDGTIDNGGWGQGATEATPDENSIFTVQLSDGANFRMPALHLITKEIREWLWITAWWSPDPNTDFGADRPAEITALGGPWKNYKMCAVVTFNEQDPNPTGGYPTGPGSLGDALKAAYSGVGGPTWCSNQYIERGDRNAQTNCVGCHQHAGTDLLSETVLADPVKFPKSGNTKVRKNFRTDYTFALTGPSEGLAAVQDNLVQHYDSVDR